MNRVIGVFADIPLRFPASRAVESMERRALAVPYSCVVEKDALGWTAEAEDVP